MGRTACTEPQCLYKSALYPFTFYLWIQLAGVPVVARDYQSRNPMYGVIFWYKEKGLHNLLKSVTVKYTP
jgi:hypothetical protein